MNLVIREQRYPTATGETPLSYAIFLDTDETHDDIHEWQDCEGVFIAYSWTREGAERAIAELTSAVGGHSDVSTERVLQP